MDKNAFKNVCQRLDEYRDEMVHLQVELTSIPAVSPAAGGEGEWKRARVLQEYLKRFGADACQTYDPRSQRAGGDAAEPRGAAEGGGLLPHRLGHEPHGRRRPRGC